MGNCHPEKTIVDRGKADVAIGFRGVTFYVQLIIILLYWMLIKYIVYITFGFKTIHVKWILVFVFVRRIFKRLTDASQNLWWTVRT